MMVLQFPKDAPDHLIDKIVWALIRRDFGGEVLLDAEMDRLPCHSIPQAHDASGHASNWALVGMRHRLAMEVNAERQIETPVRRRGDQRFEVDSRHASRTLPLISR